MAKPVRWDLDIVRGDLYSITLTIIDGNEDPIDLTAVTLTAQVRPTPDSPTVIDFAVDDSDAEDGIVVLSLTPEQTGTLKGKPHRWDLESDAGPETLAYGVVNVLLDVTHA